MTNRSAQSQLSGQFVSFDTLASIKTPPPTETYAPVSHAELIQMVQDNAEAYLPGYVFKDEAHALSPTSGENYGNKAFSVLTYAHEEFDHIGLSIGIRNSYDQSMAMGVCMGAKVFVCDNLCFSGDIRVSRKHTGEATQDVLSLIRGAMSQAPTKHRSIEHDRLTMLDHEITNDMGYALMGVAYGRQILKPRQLLAAHRAWDKPPQEDFEDRNLWSLYNALTEALKSSGAKDVMERHVAAHQLVMGTGIEYAQGI
jgi:hypothetical protein